MSSGGPRLTEDLDAARRDLADHGLCLVARALEPGRLDRTRARLYEVARAAPPNGRGYRLDADLTNQRIWTLLNYGQEFVDLSIDPTALELVEALLGRAILLSNISANITEPGGGEMLMHCDQGYFPTPYPAEAVAANAMWLLDEFTADNGATRYVPRSHRLDHGPIDHEGPLPATVPLVAPAGTLAVMDGRLWHQTGWNRTADQTRAGVFAYYTRPYIRTQENWFLSLADHVVEKARQPGRLRQLLGFDAWRGLGLVDGGEHGPTR